MMGDRRMKVHEIVGVVIISKGRVCDILNVSTFNFLHDWHYDYLQWTKNEIVWRISKMVKNYCNRTHRTYVIVSSVWIKYEYTPEIKDQLKL